MRNYIVRGFGLPDKGLPDNYFKILGNYDQFCFLFNLDLQHVSKNILSYPDCQSQCVYFKTYDNWEHIDEALRDPEKAKTDKFNTVIKDAVRLDYHNQTMITVMEKFEVVCDYHTGEYPEFAWRAARELYKRCRRDFFEKILVYCKHVDYFCGSRNVEISVSLMVLMILVKGLWQG